MLNLQHFHLNQWEVYSGNALDKVSHYYVKLRVIRLRSSGKFFIKKIQMIDNLFYFDIAEPVGSKAPTFSTDANSISFTRNVDQSFGLLCQAQAYPAPIFRQVAYDTPYISVVLRQDTINILDNC